MELEVLEVRAGAERGLEGLKGARCKKLLVGLVEWLMGSPYRTGGIIQTNNVKCV